MKTVILCGGEGTRLRELTELLPKPMGEIGDNLILWHLMSCYSHHGFEYFILCLSYKGQIIKNYFLEYQTANRDVVLTVGQWPKVELLGTEVKANWRVVLADTGAKTLTGTRLRKVWPYLDNETFSLTYGDGVSNVDLKAALAFHKSQGRLATITGVRPPSRFGEIEAQGSKVVSFWEKLTTSAGLINGGFIFLEPDFFRYLPADGEDEMLELGPLKRCVADGQLSVYQYDGFWQCMDTIRDWQYLEQLWSEINSPWKTWK
jgi:glucose-1-phosphate cytidylyltransferase